jgi:phospholipase C
MSYDVGTVFIVMMENRSFDHMLGHLHASNPEIDGIRRDDPEWLAAHSNKHAGETYPLRQSRTPGEMLPGDPPHGRKAFELQLGAGEPSAFALDGFVANYAKAEERPRIDRAHPPAVMDWFDRDDVPVLSFLASQFRVCNRWHAALPAGTQPNKLMAMGGSTLLDHNQKGLPNQRLVYDWLEDVGTPWRVYHDGMPFFAMMPNWAPVVGRDQPFRKFERFAADLAAADPASFPRVVFIEPCYTSNPQLGTANDDHAPNGIARGQAFLRKVYEAIAASPLWSRSVTVITYDENGGFYDHVSPPAVVTDPPPGANYQRFETLGVRVPAVIVSPYVRAGTVSNTLFDHTSILKLLGSLFGGQYGYEHPVNARPVGNAIDVLNNPGGRPAPRMPRASAGNAFAAREELAPAGGRVPGTLPSDDLEISFQMALDEIRKTGDPEGKFSDLLAAFPPLTAGLPESPLSEVEAPVDFE